MTSRRPAPTTARLGPDLDTEYDKRTEGDQLTKDLLVKQQVTTSVVVIAR